MMECINKEKAIRSIVSGAVKSYANGFSTRHLAEVDDENGVINMKIHNVFIAALGPEIQYYSALARSLDSSLGNMLESMAISIAALNYEVSQHVEGVLYKEQTDYIAELLEQYKRSSDRRVPKISDYLGITKMIGTAQTKRHESDYYLIDNETGMSYLIELKIGGDLDNKKARSEKEALLEQYCILTNRLGEDKVKILFATAYNRYGEGKPWTQGRVRQFFCEDELCISRDFWNLVCKSENGYDIVIDEYKKNAHFINEALDEIKDAYLPNT
ncbi:TdeIII family type II restriction endonuclease [uncultured Bacteroides sp.]|uniref:TdeIII family type II restriction endonuclease n=1 Tax=uncultured Bacteroides sp. TaxID=162156 RepID=UPI0026040FBE|nr:TdeIII family type II restriction endonuclease [uncultured Bacteroides sp.]